MNGNGLATATLAITLALAGGCVDEHPTYDTERPTPDKLYYGNTGVQAKDVLAATDLMAHDLLALPALNASQTQWTVVLSDVENKTTDPTMTYGVFIGRLRSRLSALGQGRVALIENKRMLHELQDKELENPGAAPAGVQPDFALYVTIDQMPNRATDYFLITGTLTGLKGDKARQLVWSSPPYEFQSAR